MRELHILGGGFAGVWAAMSAAAEREIHGAHDIAVRLFSNSPNLTIRPRLYEGASEALRVPLAPLMDEIGVDFNLSEAVEINSQTRITRHADSSERRFDRLVLATGSQLRQPPIPGAQRYALSIDTFEEAARLDRRLEERPAGDSAIVIVGASFTGLELATELRGRLGSEARIILVDRAAKIGPDLGSAPRPHIEEAIKECGIETRLNTGVKEIRKDTVHLGGGEVIKVSAVILATGMMASPLTRCIPGEYDQHGRIVVDYDLKVTGVPSIFAAGDTAHALADNSHVTYFSCQHALQLGRYAGYNALHDLLGNATYPYRQEYYATCIDLGPWGALFTTGWERKVGKTRQAGKEMKQQINTQWIYPPAPTVGRKAIFDQIGLSAELGRRNELLSGNGGR